MRGFGPQHGQMFSFLEGRTMWLLILSVFTFQFLEMSGIACFMEREKRDIKIVFLKMSSGLKEIVSRSPFVECKSISTKRAPDLGCLGKMEACLAIILNALSALRLLAVMKRVSRYQVSPPQTPVAQPHPPLSSCGSLDCGPALHLCFLFCKKGV